MAKVTARNIDFSGVKDGGQFNKKRIPEGDYLAIITKVEDAVGKGDDKAPMYLFSIKIKKYPSSVLPYYCVLNKENQLWKLRNIMIAGGKNVPKTKMKVDPNLIVGKTIGVSVQDSEYEKDGKTVEQSEIQGVFPAAELADVPGANDEVLDDSDEPEEDEDAVDAGDLDMDSDEEAEPEVEAEAEDEEDEEEAVADPYADLDRTALKAALKARDASFVAKKSQTDDDLRALLRAGDEDGEEDEAEEVEPEPAPKAKAKAGARPKASEINDEELDELNIDDI